MSLSDLSTLNAVTNTESLFSALHELSYDGIGITRESYGASEEAAIKLIESIAQQHGLRTERDDAANLFVSLEGATKDDSFILCGSHIDSVPQGGNYDGAAGVIAGLLCLCKIKTLGIVPRRTIKLVVLRGEESAWFGKPCLGSSALLGLLGTEDLLLKHCVTGKTLLESMRSAGVKIDRIHSSRPLIDQKKIAAYFELHIEQGPVLVENARPLAIVNAIRGNIRHSHIVCIGEAGHSGAVPRSFRHDAVLATADLLMRLDRQWEAMLQNEFDLVVTSGIINTNSHEHAITRIPGEVTFSLDIRSQREEDLDIFYDYVREECRQVEIERGVSFHFDRKSHSQPVALDAHWIKQLGIIARRLGMTVPIIPSGAGHDAAVFAQVGIPTAMIFVRNKNGSHNPHEAMEIADFLKGTQLLYEALLEAA